MTETLQHPKNGKAIKVIGLVLLGVILVAGMAYGTISLLSVVAPKTQNAVRTLTPEQQAAEQATQNMKSANSDESSGDTAAAIANYKKALENYQKAGDKAGEEGVKLKLQYLESLK